ncbi:MAG TPA: preprotein translocase subunit SecE [Deltaproteobacteria bacterium]|nr:preprotein translocase subunit SecE [Deltaproteobacteria bacterium]
MKKLDEAKQFISEARQELKKVTWLSRQQTMTSTWVVLVVVFIVSIFLGLMDLVLGKLVRLVLS